MSTRRWILDLAGVAALSSAVTAVVYRVWSIPLRVPFVYTGDALTQASVVDGIVHTGWWFTNARLGAPDGFEGYDFPLGGEMGHYLAIKAATVVSGDAILLTNLYFLASFVLVAVSAFVALRLMGLRPLLAHALALVYAFAPYHLLRGTIHLTLAAYWSVPLGCLLCWWVLHDESPFTRSRWRTRRGAGAAVCCALVAVGGAYYAAFTGLGLVVCAAMVGLRRRWWRATLPGLATAAAVALLVVLATAPSLAYWHANGRNPEAGRRPLSEQDIAPLRPIQLLTPVPEHRLGALDSVGQRLMTGPSNSEPSQFLGLLASAGFVLALVSVAGAVAGRRGRWWSAEPEVGLLVVGFVFVGVGGGLDWLTGLAGLTEIRAWGRLSIVIAFWSLVVLARPLELLVRRAASWRTWAPVPMIVAIAALGLADQVPRHLPDPERNRGQYFADRRFYTAVEADLGRGAMVFQLPWSAYPEAPLVNGLLPPSELLRPLLHTDTLRWSFGAINGRDADWQAEVVRRPVPELVDTLAAVGYSALTVDRAGYGDGGAELEADLAAVLGPPTTSETGRIALYDLRAHRAELEAGVGAAALDELATEARTLPTFWYSRGFLMPLPAPDGDQHWAGRSSRIEVWNRSGRDRPAAVTFEVRTLSGADDTVTVRAGGSSRDVAVPLGEWVPVSVSLELGEGRTAIDLRAAGDALAGDVRQVHLVVRNPSGHFTG